MTILNEEFRRKNVSTGSTAILNHQVRHAIDFFSSRPEDSMLLNFYNNFIGNNELILRYVGELKIAIVRILHAELVPQNEFAMRAFFSELLNNFTFSQSFLDRVSPDSYFLRDFMRSNLVFKEVGIMKALYKKVATDDNDPLKYLWTRDSLNPFDLNHFLSLNGNILKRSIRNCQIS